MKSIIIFLFAVSSSFISLAQNVAFSNVSLASNNNNNEDAISFSIPRERNVRHYRIEASNDGKNFEVISTIPAKANSMFTINYHYNLSAYDFTYYRIGIVQMNGQMPYSNVVMKKPAFQEKKPIQNINPPNDNNTIVLQ